MRARLISLPITLAVLACGGSDAGDDGANRSP